MVNLKCNVSFSTSFSQQSISIEFKFGVGDYVREITSPAKVGSGPMSDRDTTCMGQHIRVLWLFLFLNRATAHTDFRAH